MMPAIADEETEVPPTAFISTSSPLLGLQGAVSESQMTYADNNVPPDAKRETSGTSRLLSVGTPMPVCHDGLAYPPEQVAGAVPPGVEHVLMPPVLPTTPIRSRSTLSLRTDAFHGTSG